MRDPEAALRGQKRQNVEAQRTFTQHRVRLLNRTKGRVSLDFLKGVNGLGAQLHP